ncbi:hypothetical protein V6N13_115184 [Hibiscus sabdariffa]
MVASFISYQLDYMSLCIHFQSITYTYQENEADTNYKIGSCFEISYGGFADFLSATDGGCRADTRRSKFSCSGP